MLKYKIAALYSMKYFVSSLNNTWSILEYISTIHVAKYY